MEIDTSAFRALTERVDQLVAEVAELRDDAFVLRTLEELRLQRVYGHIPQAGRPAPKAPNPRLLRGEP